MNTAAASNEDRLGDALEVLLEQGADGLDSLAEGLNRLGVAPRAGAAWTAASLDAEFARLGE